MTMVNSGLKGLKKKKDGPQPPMISPDHFFGSRHITFNNIPLWRGYQRNIHNLETFNNVFFLS